MKFGITPISLEIIEPPFDLKNLQFPFLVEKAINAGYEHIELSMDLEYVLPGALSRRIIKKLKHIQEKMDISYSIHLPIWSIELASPNAVIRDASIRCAIDSIKRTSILNPLAYVIHLTGGLAAEFSKVSLDSKIQATIFRIMNGFAAISIEKILKETGIAPGLIAVENVEFPFSITRQLIDKYNLSVCLDFGHQICGYSGKETVFELWELHKDKTIELHLNDGIIMANGIPNDHIAIGDGSFPLDLIDLIIQDGFQGPAVFELPFAAAQKSLQRIRAQYPSL
ncbi:MAG: cobamide remodeling phosphodiesterase CbiR [Candidatus Helarchaeota archaeon]